MSKNYDTQVQKLFIEMMLADPQSYVRVQNIFNSNNFDRSLQSAAKTSKLVSARKTSQFYLRILTQTGTAASALTNSLWRSEVNSTRRGLPS